MKISLSMKERDLVARSLYRMVMEKNSDARVLYKVGKLLDTLRDDEREKYYVEIQKELERAVVCWEKERMEYLAGSSKNPGPRPTLDKGKYIGREEEFEIDPRDFEFIKEALGKGQWWLSDDGKAVDDIKICISLLEKFGVSRDLE